MDDHEVKQRSKHSNGLTVHYGSEIFPRYDTCAIALPVRPQRSLTLIVCHTPIQQRIFHRPGHLHHIQVCVQHLQYPGGVPDQSRQSCSTTDSAGRAQRGSGPGHAQALR